MSEDDRFGGSATPPQPPPSQFGSPPPPDPFGAPPPPDPFGAPPASGQPLYPSQQYPSTPRRGLPVWAIVAICVPVGLVVLGILAAIAIPMFLNARSTPVMPTSVAGVARSTDAGMTKAADNIHTRVSEQNPKAKVDAAGYGSLAAGYLLMSMNRRVDPAVEFSELGVTDGQLSFGEVRCGANARLHLSLCLRNGLRGSIELFQLGDVKLSALAAKADAAWAEQPFGH